MRDARRWGGGALTQFPTHSLVLDLRECVHVAQGGFIELKSRTGEGYLLLLYIKVCPGATIFNIKEFFIDIDHNIWYLEVFKWVSTNIHCGFNKYIENYPSISNS